MHHRYYSLALSNGKRIRKAKERPRKKADKTVQQLGCLGLKSEKDNSDKKALANLDVLKVPTSDITPSTT